jgi:hypothetical protein
MRGRGRFLAFALALLCAFPARADNGYAPGTVGYLYEDCRAAVRSETAAGFTGSYCFSFGIGYGFGGLNANGVMPVVEKNDPCAADKEKLYDQYDARFCPAILKPPPEAVKNPVLSALHLFFGWVDFLKENGRDDVLDQPVTTALNGMIAPGAFCDRVMAAQGKDFPYDMSPAVRKFTTNLLAVRKAVMARSYAAAYEECTKDSDDPDSFRASLCGAEALGYLTGVNSTRQVLDHRIEAGDKACAPAMTRIYHSLDVATYRCHGENTEPLLLALAFIRENKERFENPDAAGGKTRFGTLATALPRLRLCHH